MHLRCRYLYINQAKAADLGQTAAVHAPSHDAWGTVTCDECQSQFSIGPNHIYGSRITAAECAKRLEDHRASRAHADSYEIPD